MFGAISKPKPVDLVYSCLDGGDPVGDKNNVPIVLIHGLTMNKETWKGIDEELALKSGKKVYIPDLRNHGESPYTDEYDVEAMTEDVINLLDKLQISKAILLGHSLGGKIALHLALNYPTRVEKLIVEDMRPNSLTAKAVEQISWYFRILKEVDSIIVQGLSEKETKDVILKRVNEEFKKMEPPIVIEDTNFLPIKWSNGKCHWKINPMLISVVLKDIMEMLNESIGCFHGPSLFIYGTESKNEVNEDENNIKRLFPNAQLFGVKDAGHEVHLLPEFIEAIIPFINGKEAQNLNIY